MNKDIGKYCIKLVEQGKEIGKEAERKRILKYLWFLYASDKWDKIKWKELKKEVEKGEKEK